MDDFTSNHLKTWIEHTVHLERQESVEAAIRSIVAEDPTLLDTYGWPEIRRMAENEGRI